MSHLTRILGSLTLIASLAGTQAVFAQKSNSPQQAPSKTAPHPNSKNAQSLITFFDSLQRDLERVKKDPFDPSAEQRQRSSIIEKYTGRQIFVPPGRESGIDGQSLTTLYFSTSSSYVAVPYIDGTIPAALGSLVEYKYPRPDCDGGGHTLMRGYAIETTLQKLRAVASDFGNATIDQQRYNPVRVTGISIDTIRSLNGNIERYVTFNSIANVSHMVSSGITGTKCWGNNEDLRSVVASNFVYEFVDKATGRNVLTLTFSD